MTGGMNIDKLKKVMAESYAQKVLRDLDGRTFANHLGNGLTTQRKPFNHRLPTHFLHDATEDDDAYILDEE